MLERFVLNAQDTVLVIIDLQERLMAAMEQGEAVCRHTKLLLTAAQQLSLPVMVTQQYTKGLGPTVGALVEALPENHQFLEKTHFDAVPDGLLERLEALGRRSVLVCGSETHVCVYQTVRSLLAGGYRVFPVEDAICSRFPHNYVSGLTLMREMGATVLTAEGAAFDLMKVSGTSEFKVISKALK